MRRVQEISAENKAGQDTRGCLGGVCASTENKAGTHKYAQHQQTSSVKQNMGGVGGGDTSENDVTADCGRVRER